MNVAIIVLAALLTQAAPSQPAVDPEAKGKALALLKEGTALFEQGDYAAALERFEAAYGVFPSPKLQFNIGQANRDLGRPVEALAAFERFLAGAPDASVDARADARRSVMDLRNKLGQVSVECSTPGTEIAIDGRLVGESPLAAPLWATPGRHQITGRHAEFNPAIEEVTVAAGQTKPLALRLQRASRIATVPRAVAPAATADRAPPALVAAPSPVGPDSSSYRTYVWAGAATTAGLGVGAVIAGLVANARYDELQASCGKTTAGCPEGQIDSVKSRVAIRNVLWVLTGTAAAFSGVMFYLDSQDKSASVAFRF